MGAPERDLIRERLLGLGDNERLFRANSGMAWTGEHTRKGNFIIIKNPRPFRGMPEGFGDLVGFESVTVTEEMVGQKFARFVMEEVKATGRLSKAQRRFRDLIVRMGGVFRTIKPPS